jgi:hypothetical protein
MALAQHQGEFTGNSQGIGKVLFFWTAIVGRCLQFVHALARAASGAPFAASGYVKTEHEKYLAVC